MPTLLDVIEIPLEGPRQTSYQRENWLVRAERWRLKRRPGSVDVLQGHIDTGPQLLGGSSDRVAVSMLHERAVQDSLALIRPDGDRVTWISTTSYLGHPQIRAEFRLSNQIYNLSVTDPIWEMKVPAAVGRYSSSDLGIAPARPLLLTISLGEPFNGDCYKLVAGVIVL
jgi:hypothetical protein